MSDPVVEELLEKGARWLARFDETDYETGGSARQRWYLDRAGQMLDAVFPEWREGITREWIPAYRGEPIPGEPSRIDRERVDEIAAQAATWLPRADVAVLERWVGPWVPVEEGTDG